MMQRSALAVVVGAFALVVASSTTVALEPCEENCAELTVEVVEDSVAVPGPVTVRVSFQQGPNDGEAGQGIDEIAAIAFTVGIPGDGTAARLRFDCQDGTLAPGTVEVNPSIDDIFAVVIENAECNNRDRCLCPGAGQVLDDFINIVMYGPKELVDEGPVNIPVLPNGGELFTLNLRAAAEAEVPPLTLHIFVEADDGDPAKPQFSALFSVGDQAAIDQTADREADRSRVLAVGDTVIITGDGCTADCNSSNSVAVNEIIICVNIALGNSDLSSCPACDGNSNGDVDIADLIAGVGNLLNGCSP